MSSHVQRLLVALFAIPLFFLCIVKGEWWFFALITIISVQGVRESNFLLATKGANGHPILSIGFALAICVLFYTGYSGLLLVVLLSVVLSVLIVGMFESNGSANLNSSATLWSIAYVTLPLVCLLELRNGSYPVNSAGVQLICVILGSIWACDSLAYYGGRFFGKHKLFERVSPKKTWEGAIAGFIGGIAGVLLVRYLFIQAGETFYLDAFQVSIIGALGGSLGQLGDLAESWLKRDAGVKDSSSIIPGHGGVLDRFDSLLFVAPATYVYVKYFV